VEGRTSGQEREDEIGSDKKMEKDSKKGRIKEERKKGKVESGGK